MSAAAHTQEFMGRFEMLERLSAQLGSRPDAIGLLQKRGHLEADGVTWTEAGALRNGMTAAERALGRAAAKSGKGTAAYSYDARSNTARLK